MTATKPMLTEFPGYPSGTVRPVMTPEGSGSSGILVMAEALAEHEEREGLPLRPYAEAGSVFERALHRAGISRQALTLTNLVWYRPPRNWLDGAPWEHDAIRVCRPLNDELISRVKPKVILALGGMAMRELTGLGHGEKEGILTTRGFIVPALTHRTGWEDDGSFTGKWKAEETIFARSPIPVIGTLHPSFLRRGSKDRQADEVQAKTIAAGGGTAGMALMGLLIRDLQLADWVARNGVPRFTYDDYRLGAALADWEALADWISACPDPEDLIISYDFETQDSLQVLDEGEEAVPVREPTQVQVSLRPGHALVSPWTPELTQPLRRIIESRATKLDWNGRKFDRLLLRAMGIRTDLGRWVDGMDFWHHAQPDLPRGLQSAASFFCPEAGPWKHRSASEPLWYGALDVDMPRRIYDGLERTLVLTRHPVSGVTLLQGHEDQVVRVAPVLDGMTRRGIPVDESRRTKLDEEFTVTLAKQTSEMQTLYPETLKTLHPPSGYVRVPAERTYPCELCGATGKRNQISENRRGEVVTRKSKCSDCGGRGWKESVQVADGWVRLPFTCQVKCTCDWAKNVRQRAKLQAIEDCPACGNTGKVTSTRTRWAKRLPFLPGSPDQVKRYIDYQIVKEQQDILAKTVRYRQTRWYMPQDHKTHRDTTGEAELRRLAQATGDELLPKVLEFREIAKMRGTYVRGWAPGPDGRVHPNFGFKPATGQLSSDSPNSQNFPTHSTLSSSMKKMIRATVGKVMIKLDWKSFHLVTGAFEAQDTDALRIARVDIHSFLVLVGLLRLEKPEIAFGWPDDELRDRLKWYRRDETTYPEYARRAYPGGMTFNQIRDALAKRVVYGWEFGQGPRSLWTLNQESFASIAEAEACQMELRKLFPKIAEWQKRIRLQADRDAMLVSRHGYVRRFWDVFHRRPVKENFQPRGDQVIWINSATGERWLLTPGDDAEAVVAFLPANDAFGIKRLALTNLHERGWDEEFGLISETHDDFRFECPADKVDDCVHLVKGIMEAKSKVLVDSTVAPDGLWCEVEAKSGPSWAEMTEVTIR